MNLAWTVSVSNIAERQLRKLDRPVQKRILDWLNDRIEGCKNPRHFGEPLKGEHAGLWRYRVGGYRILCEIRDQKIVVLVLTVGHRRQIYKRESWKPMTIRFFWMKPFLMVQFPKISSFLFWQTLRTRRLPSDSVKDPRLSKQSKTRIGPRRITIKWRFRAW